MKADSST